MKKKKKEYSYFRQFNTTQERKLWLAHKDQVKIRGRRSANSLPNSWDDLHSCSQKTWKVKREKQYYNRSSLNKYIIKIKPYCCEYRLINYFESQNIGYRLGLSNSYTLEEIIYWHHTEIQKQYLKKLLYRRIIWR